MEMEVVKLSLTSFNVRCTYLSLFSVLCGDSRGTTLLRTSNEVFISLFTQSEKTRSVDRVNSMKAFSKPILSDSREFITGMNGVGER